MIRRRRKNKQLYNRLYDKLHFHKNEGKYYVCFEANLKTIRVISLIEKVTFVDLENDRRCRNESWQLKPDSA